MIYDYFAGVDLNGVVYCQRRQTVPNEGPSLPDDGLTYFPLVEPIDWSKQPSDTSKLYWNDGEPIWQETISIETLRELKNSEINLARENSNANVFMFQGKAIRCRPLDRSDIDGTNGYVALFGEFPQGWAGGWKAADNSYVQIATVDDWKAFYKAMVDTGNANFRYAQQLKARLAVAETHEQVAAIKWEKADA